MQVVCCSCARHGTVIVVVLWLEMSRLVSPAYLRFALPRWKCTHTGTLISSSSSSLFPFALCLNCQHLEEFICISTSRLKTIYSKNGSKVRKTVKKAIMLSRREKETITIILLTVFILVNFYFSRIVTKQATFTYLYSISHYLQLRWSCIL